MARALNDIITELNSVYNPQRDLYNTQLTQLDPQMQAEEKGLEVAKNDAFADIVTQANRRGVAFGGIPLAEQAKYTGSQFLPSVANLRNRYLQHKFNLQDALAKITQDQYLKGQSIYQEEQNRDAAERARAASGGNGTWTPPTNTNNNNNNEEAVNVSPEDQLLYNQMFVKGDSSLWSAQDLVNDYNATLKSAQYGNQRDIKKIQFYHSFRPDLFGSTQPSLNQPSGGTNALVPNLSQSRAVNYASQPFRR